MSEWPPEHAELVLEFSVLGEPKTAGSKVSFVPKKKDGSLVRRQDGQPMVVTNDSSGAKGKAWRQDVAAAAMEAMEAAAEFEGELLAGPLVVEMIFYRARPAGHWRTGRNAGLLRDSAPAAPDTRPDVLKLARAVEDALSTVVYGDDAQIVDGRYRKVFGTPERAEVRVWRLVGPAPDAVSAAQAQLIA